MKTVKLRTLSEGDKFKFTFSNAVWVVQHKHISATGGIGVLLASDGPPEAGGVYHPDSDVVPVFDLSEYDIKNRE